MSATAKEIIQSLPSRMKTGAGTGIDIYYHFDISGDNGGKFTVTVKDGVCKVEDGLIDSDPKCVITTTDKVYEEVETGKTNPQMALLFGKIKVSNVGSLMKFAEMFNAFKES